MVGCLEKTQKKFFFGPLLCLETPRVCPIFAKKPLDVLHRYMDKYLCKPVSVQCVQTLNYYARKIKLPTMLWNVGFVITMTPPGRTQKQLQNQRQVGVCETPPHC